MVSIACDVKYRETNVGKSPSPVTLNNANGDSWQDIIVILNASKKAQKVAIPEGCWTSVCEGGIINLAGIAEYKGKEINVAPQEAIIIHR